MINNQTSGAVSSGHELTTRAGIRILAQGGNAVDAAIAAACMACVCEPVLSSPAGGGFAMIKNANGTTLTDFFAQTPLQQKTGKIDFTEIQADFGKTKQGFHIGNASSATPGFIPGLLAMHKKHARLGLEQLVAPAIEAAINGFPISPFQYFLSTVVSPILLFSDASRQIFAPQGKLLKTGEHYANKGLAAFFDQFARHGENAFPVNEILTGQQTSGHLQQSDFDNYQVIERKPLSVQTPQGLIHLNPLPSAGGCLISVALANLTNGTSLDVAAALKQTDIARQTYGHDLEYLLSQMGPHAFRGTTHISVVDNEQNACAITLSNGEGNGTMIGDTGFMMNNMLGEADINPAGKLGWPTNQRMSSMMCPTIIEHKNGSLIALGSGGSNRIRSTIFQVLVNLLINNRSIAESVSYPRMHIENDHLDYEKFNDQQINQALADKFPDHRCWSEPNLFFGGCHIAAVNKYGKFKGVGDARRDGYFASLN